jgi:hypothetical protein
VRVEARTATYLETLFRRCFRSFGDGMVTIADKGATIGAVATLLVSDFLLVWEKTA